MAGAIATPLHAQARGRDTPRQSGVVLRGRVVRQDSTTPAPYSGVEIVETHERHLAAADGSFSFKLAPGTYHVRVRQLGFAPRDTSVVVAAGTVPRELIIRVVARTVTLSRVMVRDPERCTKPGVDSLDEPVLYGILATVRENASRELLLRRSYPFEYTTESVLDTAAVRDTAELESLVARRVDRTARPVVDTLRYRSDSMPPYVRGQIIYVDLTDWRGARERMRLPETVDFLNDSFVATHCFDYKSEASGDYALNFRPLATLGAPDVEGRVTLDSLTYVIRTAEFRLTRPELVGPGFQRLEVRTTYREVIPRIAVASEITATQMFRVLPTDTTSHLVAERQTIRSLRFVGAPPPGIAPVLDFVAMPERRVTGSGPPLAPAAR